MKPFTKTLLLISASALVGAGLTATLLLKQAQIPLNSTAELSEQKALYWVAPMDPNYQRDEPGKSPMGMDLVAVYANGGNTSNSAGIGTISISPSVVNNLGVRTAITELRPLETEIVTVGYVQYDQDRIVHIHPRVEGWIESLYVKSTGDSIEKGQPLYKIYAPQLVSAQDELVLALNRNNQALVKASEDRLKALQLDNHFIEELKQTRQVQQNITFYAPQTGVVDNLNIREGFYVKPGTTLMSLAVLDEVWVEAEVFERQVSMIELGLPVTMTTNYLPRRTWHGKVDYIYPTLDPNNRTLKVRLRFNNSDSSLKPNMFTQVVIEPTHADPVLQVPNEAIIRTGHQNRVVLALGEGHYKSIEVSLGRMGKQFTEVLSGLSEGEEIVISAQFLLDSESSKTSDFKRMKNEPEGSINGASDSPWVESIVEEIMPDSRMLKLTHSEIKEWDWPVMTMAFAVDEQVDISTLYQGMIIQAQVNRGDGMDFRVIDIHLPEQATNDGVKAMKTGIEQIDNTEINDD